MGNLSTWHNDSCTQGHSIDDLEAGATIEIAHGNVSKRDRIYYFEVTEEGVRLERVDENGALNDKHNLALVEDTPLRQSIRDALIEENNTYPEFLAKKHDPADWYVVQIGGEDDSNWHLALAYLDDDGEWTVDHWVQFENPSSKLAKPFGLPSQFYVSEDSSMRFAASTHIDHTGLHGLKGDDFEGLVQEAPSMNDQEQPDLPEGQRKAMLSACKETIFGDPEAGVEIEEPKPEALKVDRDGLGDFIFEDGRVRAISHEDDGVRPDLVSGKRGQDGPRYHEIQGFDDILKIKYLNGAPVEAKLGPRYLDLQIDHDKARKRIDATHLYFMSEDGLTHDPKGVGPASVEEGHVTRWTSPRKHRLDVRVDIDASKATDVELTEDTYRAIKRAFYHVRQFDLEQKRQLREEIANRIRDRRSIGEALESLELDGFYFKSESHRDEVEYEGDEASLDPEDDNDRGDRITPRIEIRNEGLDEESDCDGRAFFIDEDGHEKSTPFTPWQGDQHNLGEWYQGRSWYAYYKTEQGAVTQFEYKGQKVPVYLDAEPQRERLEQSDGWTLDENGRAVCEGGESDDIEEAVSAFREAFERQFDSQKQHIIYHDFPDATRLTDADEVLGQAKEAGEPGSNIELEFFTQDPSETQMSDTPNDQIGAGVGNAFAAGLKQAVAQSGSDMLLDLFERFSPEESFIDDMLKSEYGREMARNYMAMAIAIGSVQFDDHVPYAEQINAAANEVVTASASNIGSRLFDNIRAEFGSLASMRGELVDWFQSSGLQDYIDEDGNVDTEGVVLDFTSLDEDDLEQDDVEQKREEFEEVEAAE